MHSAHISKSILPLSTANQLVFEYNVEKYKSADVSAVVIILHTFPQISFVKYAKHAQQFHDKTQKLMKKKHHLHRHKTRENKGFMFKNNQEQKILIWKGHPNAGFQIQTTHKTCTLFLKNMI